jgi:hypothetical protein
MLEQIQRDNRVKFNQMVRVVPLSENTSGPPRAFRTAALNLSKRGIFVQMKEPFEPGTKVAISLEAAGRVLPFAEAEVSWKSQEQGRTGFGAQFVNFLHPESKALVNYLVDTIEKGKPLLLKQQVKRKFPMKWAAIGGAAAAAVMLVVLTFALLGEKSEPANEGPVAEEIEFATPIETASAPSVIEVAPAAPAVAPAVDSQNTVPTMEATVVNAAPPVALSVAANEPVAMEDENLVPLAKVEPAAAPIAPSETKSIKRELKFQSGALKGLTVLAQGNHFEVVPFGKATLEKTFELENPSRVVMDFKGAHPIKSSTVSVNGVRVKQVRVGKTASGTRLVFDLNSDPKDLIAKGNHVLFSFQ